MGQMILKTSTLMGLVLLILSGVSCSSTSDIEDDAEIVEEVAETPEEASEELHDVDTTSEDGDEQFDEEEPFYTDSDILPVADSPILGNPEAPVTVVAFMSMQCPFSARGARTAREIVDNYDGDVRLIFKHFPLPTQRDAESASQFMEAARRQDEEAFWELKWEIFDHIQPDDSLEEQVIELGDEFGLDTEQLLEDYQAPEVLEHLERDEELRRALDITGTPTFIINGESLSGARPYEEFAKLVDQKLEEAEQMLADGVERPDLYAEAIAQHMEIEPPSPQEQESDSDDTPEEQPEVVDADALKALTIADFQTRGPEDAAVTIFGFISFNCAFSARGADIVDEVVDEYGEDVRLVYKHFPHPDFEFSEPASRAAVAAGHQGKFWEMGDALFANQPNLSKPDIFVELAHDLDLDVDQFKEDMQSTSVADHVAQDRKEGEDAAIKGTPVYLIDDQFLRGAQPLVRFRELIDPLLDNTD